MIDRELEQILQTRFRAEADGTGSTPTALYASVSGIPDAVPFAAGRTVPRRVLLLAAVVLVALVIGGVLAVGSGLIRLPRPPDEDLSQLSTAVLQPIPCDLTMDDGVAFEMEYRVDASGAPGTLVVDSDGLAIRGPQPAVPSAVPHEQRRMTLGGLSQLLGAVEASGLRDCVNLPVPGPQAVSARIDDEIVKIEFDFGLNIRVPTQAELDAAETLAERLTDPDLGIAASEWIDADWQPYEHDRWQIMFRRWEGLVPCCWTSELLRDVPWPEMVLPDGSTFMTVGSTMPIAPPTGYVETRCHVIPAAERADWLEVFGDPTSDPSIDMWMLHDGVRGGGFQISMTFLLPHEIGCRMPSDPSPRQNLIGDLDVCGYLAFPVWPGNGRETEVFDGGWALCEYLAHGWVFASRHPVSSEAATAVVANQFGRDYTTDSVAGRTVYLNACIEPDPACRPAIAISADPHLVIVVPDRQTSPDALRDLAAAVIRSIAER
jgi:hypothetical protein